MLNNHNLTTLCSCWPRNSDDLDGKSHQSVSPYDFLEQKSIWRKILSSSLFPNELWELWIFMHPSSGLHGRRRPLRKGRSLDASTKQGVGVLRNKWSFKSSQFSSILIHHVFKCHVYMFFQLESETYHLHRAFFFPQTFRWPFWLRMGCAKSLPAIVDLHQGYHGYNLSAFAGWTGLTEGLEAMLLVT